MGNDYRNQVVARAITLKMTKIFNNFLDKNIVNFISNNIFSHKNEFVMDDVYHNSIIHKENNENGKYVLTLDTTTNEITEEYSLVWDKDEGDSLGTLCFAVHCGNINTDYGKWGAIYCLTKCNRQDVCNAEFWDEFAKVDSLCDGLKLILEKDASIAFDLHELLKDDGSIYKDIKMMAIMFANMLTKVEETARQHKDKSISSAMKLWSEN